MGAKTSAKPKPRRRARKEPTPLTASARQINLDRTAITYLRNRRKDWQGHAWVYYDDVGEVKYAMNYLANSMSKVRLYAAEPTEPGKDPEATENEVAVDQMDRLDQGEGISQILRDLAVNLSVPGECYLVGLAEREATETKPARAEEWSIRSIDEISTTGGKVAVQNPGEKIELVDGEDFFARFWMSHPRNGADADSSLRGVLGSCEEITMIERALRAALRSRAATAGLLLLDNSLTFGPPDPTQDQGDGETRTDKFKDDLEAAMLAPIANPESASAVVPIMLFGDKEQIGQQNRLISFDRPLDAMLDTRMLRAIQRLAQGLNVPVEVVLGLGDTNHWSAWQITEDAFRAHIEPLMLAICQMFTIGYLQPMLRAASVADPEAYVVWYDPTKLVVRPDRGKDAEEAYTAIAISESAYRQAKGFDEEDAPTDIEKAMRLLLKGQRMDPTIQGQLLQRLDPTIEVPAPSSGELGGSPAPKEPVDPQNGPPADGPPAGPGVTAAATPRNLGSRLGAIDRTLRARIHVAADEALHRTLERAGSKIISKARKDSTLKAVIASVDTPNVARVLGPARVQSLGISESELIDGAFASLKRKFTTWTRQAQRQAVALLNLDDTTQAGALVQQDSDRSDAWAWMSASLGALAHQMLYDPSPDAPPMGEYDESMDVPYGLVREAVARAGGADGLESTDGFGISINGGTEPAGGVATGQLMSGLLGEQGQGIEGWVWVYGDYPRTRPFEPHEALDGVEFTSWDDPALQNTDNWPETPFYQPGDHDGCVCDADPIIIEQSAPDSVSTDQPEEAA